MDILAKHLLGRVAQMVRAHADKREVGGSIPLVPIIWSVGQGVKTPPFHGGNTGSNPVRTIYLEDYPSPAEGNGLENRQACKSVRGFDPTSSLILTRDGAAR